MGTDWDTEAERGGVKDVVLLVFGGFVVERGEE